MPGGYGRRHCGRGWHKRQQEAQAKPSDWFGCPPHPWYFVSPGRERCQASRGLANNDLRVAARSFGPLCSKSETFPRPTREKKNRFHGSHGGLLPLMLAARGISMPNERARPVLAFDVYGTLIDPFHME